jgi:hypothetical protein
MDTDVLIEILFCLAHPLAQPDPAWQPYRFRAHHKKLEFTFWSQFFSAADGHGKIRGSLTRSRVRRAELHGEEPVAILRHLPSCQYVIPTYWPSWSDVDALIVEQLQIGFLPRTIVGTEIGHLNQRVIAECVAYSKVTGLFMVRHETILVANSWEGMPTSLSDLLCSAISITVDPLARRIEHLGYRVPLEPVASVV